MATIPTGMNSINQLFKELYLGKPHHGKDTKMFKVFYNEPESFNGILSQLVYNSQWSGIFSQSAAKNNANQGNYAGQQQLGNYYHVPVTLGVQHGMSKVKGSK